MKREIKIILERLHPGENSNQIYSNFQKRKKRVTVLIILFGIVACICANISSHIQSKLQEGPCLQRNEWGEGNYEVILSALTTSGKQTIHYEVKERKYTYKELERLCQEAETELKNIILGNNVSLSFVTDRLYLPQSLENYPFRIIWSSSNTELIQADGIIIGEKIEQEGEKVILTALLQYQEFEEEHCYEVILFPNERSVEEQQTAKLDALLKQIGENTAEQRTIMLPKSIGNQEITWIEEKNNDSIWIILISMIGVIAASYTINKEIYEKDKQREKELRDDYPEFVSMIQSYMAAGLTMRNIFFKIAEDYQKEKNETGRKNFLSEEIVIACHLFSNGQSDEEVYRKWAERCNERHYRKLSFLLISYGKQGNDNMMRMLSEEVYQAWTEQRDLVKRKGEEAGTKLLLPMTLMLLVVMLLIILPVYKGF